MASENDSARESITAQRISLAQLEALFEVSPDPWYALDDAWRLVAFNQPAARFFGQDAGNMAGMLLWDALPMADEAFRHAHLRAAATREITTAQVVLVETSRRFELRVKSVDDVLIATVRDMQPQGELEQALVATEARLHYLTQTVRDVFWITDVATRRIQYVSPAYERIWGLPLQQLYDDPGHWRAMIHPDDRDRVEAAFLASLEGGIYDVEYRVIRPDGDMRWIRDRALQFADNGQARQAAGIAQDITKQKQAEVERDELLEREQAARAAAERAVERLARLQAVTAALSRALLPSRVAAIIVEQGLELMGARTGSMAMLRNDGVTLELVRSVGYNEEIVARWRTFPIDTRVPIADAVRLRMPIWLESKAARAERYPHLHATYGVENERAWVSVPLLANERVVGAMSLEFDEVRPFNQEDCDYLSALAQQAAYAIERTRLYQETQEALQTSDEALARLDSVLNTAPIGIALWDTELRYIHVNQALATLNNLPVRAHIGRTLPELLPGLTDRVQPLLERVLATGEPVLNYEIQTSWPSPDNENAWLVSIYPVRLPSGSILGVGATVVDITERRRTEAMRVLMATVAEELARALTVADVTDVMVTRIAPELGAAGIWVVQVSDHEWVEVVRAQGFPDELVDQWRRTPLAARAPLSDAIRSAEPIWIESREARVAQYPDPAASDLTPYGTWAAIPLIVNSQPIGGIGLSFPEFRSFDPDERALIQTVAQQYAQAYERARLHELEREARAAAELAVKTRDQFLSIAAHELKTPLTSLLGNTQLLQRRLLRENQTNEREIRTLDVIVTQSRRLNQMIAALLDASRIQGGQLSIVRAPVDLVALVERVVTEVELSLTQHKLSWSASSEVVWVAGDELRLEQVLQNLIQNAIKYSPHGGAVAVHVAQDGQQARVTVDDRGIGIPSAALPHLFQRFYRAENADPQHISGMGIGLYVVREIVQLHGGEVTVHSIEGRGSMFVVTLPIQETTA